MKKIAILPTLFTLGNAVCGFAAIACASKIKPAPPIDSEGALLLFYSGWLVMAAMLFDVFDGYIARLSRTASEFGGQLDSLCDAISFGAAPAFLLLRLGQDWEAQPMRNAIPIIAALYMVCAILRLARFNLENSPDPAYHKRFKGLPSTVAAGCVASLAMLRGQSPEIFAPIEPALQTIVKYWAPAGAILVALLMVSRVSYPHLTKQLFRGRRHFSYLVRIVLAVFVVVLIQDLALVVIFWGYALTFLGRHALLHIKANQQLPVPSSGIEEHP